MNRFNFCFAFAILLIASGSVCGYSAPSPAVNSADYQGGADSGAASAAAASANNVDNSPAGYGPSSYSNNQNVPYASGNTRGNTLTSSITYPQNKGEILIHRPAAIIVKRPPTKVLVNHPPLVVKPAPVVLHKPPAVVLRKVLVKHHPRPVKVEPVYVNVVKPPAEKYFVNEKQQQAYGAPALGPIPTGYAPLNSGASANANAGDLANLQGLGNSPAIALANADNAASNAGYQLLPNQGLNALAGLSAPSPYGVPAGPGYGAPSY